MAFKLDIVVDMHDIILYAQAHSDDLDLYAGSQWFSRGKYAALNYLDI